MSAVVGFVEVVDIHVPHHQEEIVRIPTQHFVDVHCAQVNERVIHVPQITTQERTHHFHVEQTVYVHIPYEHEEILHMPSIHHQAIKSGSPTTR